MGNRQIDALGKDDNEIQWSGLITGPNALARAQQLNTMRAAGQQLNLTWFNLNYVVLIDSLICNTEKFYQIRYDISLTVLKDGANPINTQNLVGFNEAINSDLATANSLATSIGNAAVTAAVNNVVTASNNVGTFDGASPSALIPVQAAVSSAIATIQDKYKAFSETIIRAIIMSSSTFVSSLSIDIQVQDQTTYWQLYTLQYYLQRIQANLGIINSPPNAIVITVMNTTLFKLAAQYYGDATQWPVIANANNLHDPQITTPMTLVIPPWNQQDTGGIL